MFKNNGKQETRYEPGMGYSQFSPPLEPGDEMGKARKIFPGYCQSKKVFFRIFGDSL